MNKYDYRLSIIIPCYNAEPYIDELTKVLMPQVTEDVEVIVVDDGSEFPYLPNYPGIKVIRQKNKGQSAARNKGLSVSKGKYIAFIDADDMVAPDYVSKILSKIEQGFDVLEFSWKSFGGTFMDFRLTCERDRLTNPSACTRVFNRSFIGTIRFNTKKDACEDEEFSRKVGYMFDGFKRAFITDYLYFYRTNTDNSNTKRYKQGLCNTKRITYYFEKVPSGILEEIKREDEHNEVWLLTNDTEYDPELRRYCQISKPFRIWTHILRGDTYSNVEIVNPPVRTQLCLYINYMHTIGGIETFVYNFVRTMQHKYDIVLNVQSIAAEQYTRLSALIPISKTTEPIMCDTLIMLRILDDKPKHITAKKTIRMCHACRTNPQWAIPEDADINVFVSEVAKQSFGKDGIVIHNPFITEKKKTLFLISATRIPAPDKGHNELRMRKLAEMLTAKNISFLWLNFSEGTLSGMPKGFYNMPSTPEIQPYIAKADYLVQLSDSEAYSYSLLEALTNDTAVICTPFPSATESGVIDGVTGYIVPFDMSFDVTMLLDVPQFTDKHSNKDIIKQWSGLLGKAIPTRSYKSDSVVKIRALKEYTDLQLNRLISANEVYIVTPERANIIINAGLAERI